MPISRVDPSHDSPQTLAALEWWIVWMRTWHLGPRKQELPHPGDAFVHALGAESLLFVRQEDGSVRDVYNTCRQY